MSKLIRFFKDGEQTYHKETVGGWKMEINKCIKVIII